MFTTGSKLLIGSAVLATVAAIAYGITQEGILGTIGLVSAAIALAFLAGLNVFVRDANVAVDEAGATTVSAAAQQAPPSSPWPIVGALGVALVLLSVISSPAVALAGIVLLIASTAEWMVQAWSERGSSDAAYNDDIRARLAHPLEMPILGVIGAGVIIYSGSRVMLALTKVGTVVAFSVVAALIVFVAFLFAARPKVSTGTTVGITAMAVVALVAGGAVAAISGERDMHVIETTAELAERGRCGTDESEADDKASQTLAGKTNLAATLTLDDAGTLSASVPGFNESSSRLTLPRSNPNNVVFRNDSDADRRLVIDVGPSGDTESKTLCTALVEPGGVQFLTIVFDMPTFAVSDDAHRFTVPGVDTAVVEVTVP